ncbi:uncharacterized protein LOC126335552 [Schistocerca gregaria]|uniref:uncharacterized protein LOC126335552 n=1 Tax=Schistocerca gregaria TaxID=7010 RepID=UPI00211E256F|nr:uncharacterized protein LOC126335552 [Schistocerca gregaria]
MPTAATAGCQRTPACAGSTLRASRFLAEMQLKTVAAWLLVTTAVVSVAAAGERHNPSTMSKSLFNRVLDHLSGRTILDGLARKLTNLTDRPIDISRLAEGYSQRMHKPQRLLGLPALDPLRMDSMPLNFDSDMAKVRGEAWNVTVLGISSMRARQLRLRPLSSRVDFELLFPSVSATGNYRMNGTFANSIHAFGEGPFNITVKDLNATGFVIVTPEGDHLKVKDVFVEVNLTSLQMDLQGLLGGGETGRLLSAAIGDAAPRLLQEQREDATRYISAFVRDALDRQLTSVHAAAWTRAYRSLVCAATVGLVCRAPT